MVLTFAIFTSDSKLDQTINEYTAGVVILWEANNSGHHILYVLYEKFLKEFSSCKGDAYASYFMSVCTEKVCTMIRQTSKYVLKYRELTISGMVTSG